MTYVIEAPKQATIPVVGSDALFPVRRIYCVGRNYAAHAREMGGDPTREPPFFFMKAADTLQVVPSGGSAKHPYPPRTKNYHFEIEMVAAIGKGGRDVPVEKALDHVFGYAVGLDMTRRDLQDDAKALRRPWELGKSSDLGCPVGPLHPASAVGHLAKGAITLTVNGASKQAGDLADMIWSVPEQVAYLSTYFDLVAGDIILTGTPEGVGAVVKGDTMVAAVAGLGSITLEVV